MKFIVYQCLQYYFEFETNILRPLKNEVSKEINTDLQKKFA